MTDTPAPAKVPDPIAARLRAQAGKILRLPSALHAPEPGYPIAGAVARYWDTLRGARAAPARSELDPRALSQALEFIFIAEFVAPQVARIRIAGQHIEALLGMEPRGMPLGVLFDLGARNELGTALQLVAQGARASLPLRADGGFGKPGLDGLLLLMPLTDGLGQISRILGVLETHGPIGRTPRRFRLGADRMRAAPAAPSIESSVEPAPAPSFAAPRLVPAGARPQLRVVQGGRSVQP